GLRRGLLGDLLRRLHLRRGGLGRMLLHRVQRLDHGYGCARSAAAAEQHEAAHKAEQGCEAGRSENPDAWTQAHGVAIGIRGRSLDGEMRRARSPAPFASSREAWLSSCPA